MLSILASAQTIANAKMSAIVWPNLPPPKRRVILDYAKESYFFQSYFWQRGVTICTPTSMENSDRNKPVLNLDQWGTKSRQRKFLKLPSKCGTGTTCDLLGMIRQPEPASDALLPTRHCTHRVSGFVGVGVDPSAMHLALAPVATVAVAVLEQVVSLPVD